MTHEYIEPLNNVKDIIDHQHNKIDELVTVANVLAGDTATKTSTDNVNVNETMVFADATSGAFTLTLYLASKRPGTKVNIKKIDGTANIITIDGQGSETIDGETTQQLVTQYDNITIVSDGSNWYIL